VEEAGGSDAITTVSFPVPSCTLSRADLVELARPLQDIARAEGFRRPKFAVEGRDRTLTCRSLKALEQASWPSDIRKVRFHGDGQGGRDITLWASADPLGLQKVEISGQDALWVQGVAQYYRDALKDRRNWHWLAGNFAVVMLLLPLAGPLWLDRLFPYVEVESGLPSRAAVLRRRAASGMGILLVLGLAIVGNVLYNLLT
jgi:hypothetical protein